MRMLCISMATRRAELHTSTRSATCETLWATSHSLRHSQRWSGECRATPSHNFTLAITRFPTNEQPDRSSIYPLLNKAL